MVTAVALLLASLSTAKAQDTITLRSGDQIQAQILKISDTEVEYKEWNNLTGPTRIKNVADIFMIQYENGTKEVFKEKPSVTSPLGGVDAYGRPLELAVDKNSRSYLSLGNREIGERDAMDLLGRNQYEEFLKGYGYQKGGKISMIAGGSLLGAGAVLTIIGAIEYDELLYVGIPLASGGLAGGLTGLFFYLSGKKKVEKVVEGYNRYGAYNYSLALKPTAGGIGLVVNF